MPNIEQAIFTSAETDRSAGYQVVAGSPGLCESDAHELAVWGPSHDSMLSLDSDAVSLNFHPLPSGAFCVSRTTAAGWEYSARGGHRVYTHCLLVPPEVLRRFANNPFALMKAAVAAGAVQTYGRVPGRLEPLGLAGGAAPVDQTLLVRLAANPGPQRIAALVQAALDSPCLALAAGPSAGELIAGLLNCLPVECRTEFSFSTGLKFSSRRPFRIVTLSDDPAEQRWLAQRANVTVLPLDAELPVPATVIDGWAQLIGRVLAGGWISFLGTELSKPHSRLVTADLPALGLQLLEDLDACELRSDHAEEQRFTPAEPVAEGLDSLDGLQRAHSAHRRFGKTRETATAQKSTFAAPSTTLEPSPPAVLEKLELLDDLVYQAIGGQATALEQLRTLWPQVLEELGEELVAESREQYLRYALSIWEDCVEPSGIRNPSRAVQALDVLCTLFE